MSTADCELENRETSSERASQSRNLSRAAGILISITTRLIERHQPKEDHDDDEDLRLRAGIDRGPG